VWFRRHGRGGVRTAGIRGIVEQLDRLGRNRAFLMVSGTLNRETDVIENIATAMGARCVGIFDAMPAHTPRAA
jgi:maleylacetate reductase